MDSSLCVPENDRLKAVIFDLDGVILDSMPAHVASWRAAFGEVGLDIEEDVFYRHEGNLEWETLRPFLAPRRPDLGPEVFSRLLERQREIYNHRYAAGVRVYPEAAGLLKDLRRDGLDLALVTSSAWKVLAPWLREFLELYFDLVITRDQVKHGKPSPEPYLAALDRLGLGADQALAVENAPAGIRSAKAAGLWCVALTTTLPPDLLAQADLILDDQVALSRWLKNGRLKRAPDGG
ncbi:MAG: HAD family phosphatase [Thermodesulfobacteriota bacterium]